MIEKRQRSCNLDVIRIFAYFCVVAVHFFRNTELYIHTAAWDLTVLSVCVRNFFMICVPLFMMLSGYLLIDKKPCKSYYLKIFQTVGIYVLASLACAAYRMIFVSDKFSLKGSLVGILSFKTAPYSWYVEMYIGLFMLIPFLNKMYVGSSKKSKQLLVITMLSLTALPVVANMWRLTSLSWWLNPASSEDYTQLLPDAWLGIYPFTYYFIGAYLREYPLKLRLRSTLLFLLVLVLAGGVFSVYRYNGAQYSGGKWSSYQSPLVTMKSVLVFHFLNRLNLSSVGDRGRRVLKSLSSWTLGAYLSSYVFDELLYPMINEAQAVIPYRIVYFPLVVPVVAICSLLLSAVLNWIYNLCERLVVKCIGQRKKPSQQISV